MIFLCTIRLTQGPCQESQLPSGVTIAGHCSFHQGDSCRATCLDDADAVLWKQPVTCQAQDLWSRLPPCRLAKESTSLDLVRCGRQKENEPAPLCVNIRLSVPASAPPPGAVCPGVLRLVVQSGACEAVDGTECAVRCKGSYVLLCLIGGRWEPDCAEKRRVLCPELKFAELVDCPRELGSKCMVRCPNGRKSTEKAVCLPTGEWSPLPSCYYRSQCASEEIPFGTEFLEKNCKESTAPTCSVGCSMSDLMPILEEVGIPKLIEIKKVSCNSSGHWVGLPNCTYWRERFLNETKTLCPKPDIGKNGALKGSCRSSEGSVCHYRCKQGFFPNQTMTIRCSQKKWIGVVPCRLPTCPNLPRDLIFVGSCSRLIGSKCLLKCKSGKLLGHSRVMCGSNLKWSSIPKCVSPTKSMKKNCPRSMSPNISFVSHCSFKNKERCQVKCKHQLVLVGLHLVRCWNGLWENVPRCIPLHASPYRHLKMTCPYPPRLYGNLKTVGECKSDGGFSCDLGCRDSSAKMVGPNATTCLPPGLWSKIKPCESGKKYCPGSILRKDLETIGDCSGKQVGSQCRVRCKYRPALSFTINCTKEGKWTIPKPCYCANPKLRNGMGFEENCSAKMSGSSCRIKCNKGYRMVGKIYITCQENLKWTILPSCMKIHCRKPNLTKPLMFREDCTAKTLEEQCNLECREGGKISKPGIKCLDSERWTDLPVCSCPVPFLVTDLKLNHDCDGKRPGEKCFIACKGKLKLVGRNYIQCQIDTKWSVLPKCIPNICPKPPLPNILMYAGDCSTVNPGGKCSLECKLGGKIIGPSFVTCNDRLEWSSFPNCTCPPPILPDSLMAVGKCDNLRKGSRCFLKCKPPLSLKEDNFTECQSDTRWSKLPSCKMNTCLKLKLPKTLEYAEDCSSKQPGENCRLQCREGGKLIGSKKFLCVSGPNWTDLPECTCPPPKLSGQLISNENCSHKRVGENCSLRCRKGNYISGPNHISCKKDTKWNTLPRCKPILCPDPKFPVELNSKECASKKPGESCSLKCTEGGEIIGSDKITCLKGIRWSAFPKCSCPKLFFPDDLSSKENCSRKMVGQKCLLSCRKHYSFENEDFIVCEEDYKWSPFPKCKKLVCSKPKLLNGLDFSEDCSSKVMGEKCNLECKEGGKMFGSKFITCTNKTSKLEWSNFPLCSCPPPIFYEGLKAIDSCKEKKPLETCKLMCEKKMALVGENFITCQNNTKWSTLPKCIKQICKMPKLGKHLLFKEDCSSKTIGEGCSLVCKTGGNLLFKHKISCLNSTHWTSEPECTCPPPSPSKHLEFLENCTMKLSGEECDVRCKEGFMMENSKKLICQKDLLWSLQPVCKKRPCPKPILSKNLLLDEDCTIKKPGERCRLVCKMGGRFAGINSIKCEKDDTWSPPPKCSCPDPHLHPDLEAKENCSFKFPKERCALKCKRNLTLVGKNHITCSNETEWSIQPLCELKICPRLQLPAHLNFIAPCDSRKIVTKCYVKCKHGGNMIGKDFIECLNTTMWSKFPHCTCPSPKLSEDLESISDCSSVMPRKKCFVKCAPRLYLKGRNFLYCLPFGKWGREPKCEKVSCKIPNLSSLLVFDDDCKNKIPGETCKLKCRHNGQLLGPNVIKCISSNSWSDLPKCACPLPIFNDTIESTENCSSKQPGEKCSLACKNPEIIISKAFITCDTEMEWSTLPTCEAKSCLDLVLPHSLEFKSDCSSRLIGESCDVSCKNGGNLIGLSSITCHTEIKWSEFPLCTCPTPQLSGNLFPKEDCSNVLPGGECNVECETSFRMEGQNIIKCSNSTKWSDPPKCLKICCSKPHLPPYLALDSACTIKTSDSSCDFKEIEEKCKVICKYGGKIKGNDEIKCLGVPNQWSPVPDCFCPELNIKPPLQTRRDCTRKRRGEKCEISCGSGFRIVGRPVLLCQRNAKWSTLPTCRTDFCSKPDLSKEIIAVEEKCINKTIGEECRVRCKEGGKILGKNTIKCSMDKSWSLFPDCTCPAVILPYYLITEENCDDKKRTEKCTLKCKDNFILDGEDFITCQENTKWSSFPKCAEICEKPELPSEILVTDGECARKKVGEECRVKCLEGGEIIRKNTIECLGKGRWSTFPDCTCPVPELPDYLKAGENCNYKKRLEKCLLTCKDEDSLLIGFNFTTCQPNTKWDSFPKCEKACEEPELPKEILVFDGECTKKRVGEECHVKCVEGGELIGKNPVECLEERKWSTFPDCTCPVPKLPDYLKTEENCDFKKPTEKCSLKCREDLLLEGNDSITCQSNTKWDSFPKCGEYCGEPELPRDILMFDGECSRKKVGEECLVKCIEGGELIGSNTITCQDGKAWSSLPDCACPAPKLPDYLKTEENCDKKQRAEKCLLKCEDDLLLEGNNFITCQSDTKWDSLPKCGKYCWEPELPKDVLMLEGKCTRKKVGEECHVKCLEGGELSGSNTITCQDDRKWSTFPGCTCPPLKLPFYLITEENCDEKKQTEKCSVKCKDNLLLEGDDFIICQPNTRWSSFPKCVEICEEPDLSKEILVIDGECIRKKVGEECHVKCLEGGELIGKNTIECLNKGRWSTFPDCTCPALQLPDYLKTEDNCDLKKRSERCSLKCKDGLLLEGSDFITCLPNTKWDSFPKCGEYCGEPEVPKDILSIDDDCVKKKVGEECHLSCKEGGNLTGKSTIKCQDGKTWSSLPDCTCPTPKLPDYLRTIENCDYKRRTEKCSLKCKDDLLLEGNDFITCLPNTKWDSFPKCGEYCGEPEVPKDILSIDDDCVKKKVGEECHLSCKEGGNLIGKNPITCQDGKTWSSLPDCTCPTPKLPDYLRTIENCDYIKRTEKCSLKCKDDLLLEGNDFVTCQSNASWDFFPKCKEICKEPQLPKDILSIEGNCSKRFTGETCDVRCTQGGYIKGGDKITCLGGPKGTWSAFPNCTCGRPVLTDGLVLTQRCYPREVHDRCKVGCRSGFQKVGFSEYIECQKNTKWNFMDVRCKLLVCKDPKLPIYLRFEGKCTEKRWNSTCTLRCSGGGKMYGDNTIKCVNSKWTPFPECGCPNLNLTEGLRIRGDCTDSRIGKKCYLRCEPGYNLEGRAGTMCQENAMWMTLPRCKRITSCPVPKLPRSRYLTMRDSCRGKVPGEMCNVVCTHAGSFFPVVLSNSTVLLGQIVCQPGFEWSPFPECSCPFPKLPNNLLLDEDCKNTRRNGTCRVRCAIGFQKNGPDVITCRRDASWIFFPECRKLVCAKPVLFGGILDLEEPCEKKGYNDVCKVRCRKGGKIIGENVIKCNENRRWIGFPNCTCPAPVLTNGLISVGNCESVLPGGRCDLSCLPGLRLHRGNNFITCLNDLSWTELPQCEKMQCPNPVLQGGVLELDEPCEKKLVDDVCKVRCLQGGKMLGENTIKCDENRRWIGFPICTCPTPVLLYGLISIGSCEGVRPGGRCDLYCPPGLRLYGLNSFITCQHNSSWTEFPQCHELECPRPMLQGGVLDLEEPCEEKRQGDVCRVRCLQGGRMSGENTIKCDENLHWIGYPICTCPGPVLENGLISVGSCDSVQPGGRCDLYCPPGLRLYGLLSYITCQHNTTWSVPPYCTAF